MLADAPLRFDVPAADMARAKAFYAEKLGLTPTFENPYSAQYRYADSYFVLTPSESAGKATHSLITWQVPDVPAVKSWLEGRGVVFVEYDLPHLKTENGIASFGPSRVAWFEDSEGNLLAIAD